MNFKFKSGISQYFLISFIGFAGICLLVVTLFSNFDQAAFDIFFNSDTLYLPSIYKDVFMDGNSLKGWHLNPAPNFFPDMSFYFLLMPFVKNNFIICSFAFALFQVGIILYLFVRIFTQVLPGRSSYWHLVIYSFFSVFLLEHFFFTKDFNYSFYLISNSYHTGSFVMALICFYLTIKYYKQPSYKLLLAVFLLGTFSALSDKLFIVQYSIPVVASSFFLIGKTNYKSIFLLILTNGLLIYIALKLFKAIDESNYMWIAKPYRFLDFEFIKESALLFSEQMIGYLVRFGFRSFTIYVFIVSFIGSVILFFKINKEKDPILFFYTTFVLINAVVVLVAPIFTGNYSGPDTLRYNIYPFYISSLNIVILGGYFIKRSGILFFGKYAAFCCCVVVFFIGVKFFSRTGLSGYFSYYPSSVRVIDVLSQTHGFKCGVGNYLMAKKVTMFSRKNIRVYTVFDDLAAYDHVTNENWFFKDNEFNFICFDSKTDWFSYNKYIENSRIIFKNSDFLLVKTNTFIFEKEKGYLPINSPRIKKKI